MPELVLPRNLKLSWDVVSYHLPVYELIGGLPSLYFFSHWGFSLANTYSLVFLLASLYLVIRNLQRSAALVCDKIISSA
jgi:hypothetical protein